MNRQERRDYEKRIKKIHSGIKIARSEIAKGSDPRMNKMNFMRIKDYMGELERLGAIRKKTKLEKVATVFKRVFRRWP